MEKNLLSLSLLLYFLSFSLSCFLSLSHTQSRSLRYLHDFLILSTFFHPIKAREKYPFLSSHVEKTRWFGTFRSFAAALIWWIGIDGFSWERVEAINFAGKMIICWSLQKHYLLLIKDFFFFDLFSFLCKWENIAFHLLEYHISLVSLILCPWNSVQLASIVQYWLWRFFALL